jgi:3-oxoacyl-[acyl-carrier protein] reductase
MKYALITGASGGIGYALAEAFLLSGYGVFAQYHHHGDALIPLAEQYPCCLPIAADLTDSAQVHTMFEQIHTRTSHLEVLINNAGVAHYGLLQDMTDEDWDRVMNTNLRSVFYCCREALPGMIRQGRGVILNISSVWGRVGASCEVAYSASKGGLNAFTQALAKETAPSGLRVNAIACGVIDTAMNGHLDASERAALTESIGLGRYGTPSEVADLALYLCSDKATYLSGAILPLDGCFV